MKYITIILMFAAAACVNTSNNPTNEQDTIIIKPDTVHIDTVTLGTNTISNVVAVHQ